MDVMVPDKGDVVKFDFNPVKGHEQGGYRPALVLSPKQFNKVTGLMSVCPITNTVKGWGYEVELPKNADFTGAILTDQLKNVDWVSRGAKVVGSIDGAVVDECIEKINTFLYFDNEEN